MSQNLADLEAKLNDFDRAVRDSALAELLRMAERGEVALPVPKEVANMHAHTFFSFNAYGHSPTSLAWLAKRNGYKLMGIVDFDVLDGVDEFLDACERVGVRGSAAMETRVYLPEFSTREINSPGEPGIAYHMGVGFTSSRVPPAVAPILQDMRERAAQRNRAMVERLNAYLDPVKIEYDADVIPLTPAGNPTERHIVVAYLRAAERRGGDLIAFWASKLDMPPAEVESMMGDSPKFQNHLRVKLMKKGGPGYVQPDAGSFPRVDPFHEMIVACGALPCAAWVDGLSEGEQAIGELLELLMGKGAVTFNIIPDRNWNIADPQQKKLKLQKLYEIVEITHDLGLPLNIGTEMNSFGQKLVDDFDAPELAPVRQAFLDGAYFVYGHVALERAFGLGFLSDWAKGYFPDRRERNAFYQAVGCRLPPGRARSLAFNAQMTPDQILNKLSSLS